MSQEEPPREPIMPDYQAPRRRPSGVVAIVLWIIAGLIALPVAFILLISFGMAFDNASYGAVTVLAGAVAAAVALVIFIARKASNPASPAVAMLLCVVALGILAFGVCASNLKF